MKQVLIRTAVKGVIILIGILLISTGLQLMIRFYGVEPIISMTSQQMSESYPGQNEELRKQAVDYIHKAMGLDRPFVPDLWPFDNESFWHKAEQKEENLEVKK
jgi:ABC-type dipeptide/oligopeptide/nickel transport system permease component